MHDKLHDMTQHVGFQTSELNLELYTHNSEAELAHREMNSSRKLYATEGIV